MPDSALPQPWPDATVDDLRVCVTEPTDDPDPSSLTLTRDAEGTHALTLELRHPDDYTTSGFDEDGQAAWIRAQLVAALRHPDVRLRSLRIRPKCDYFGELYRQWLADALAGLPLDSLRSLSWGHPDGPAFVELPDLTGLLAAAPGLTSLSLEGMWAEENPELQTGALTRLLLLALDVDTLEAIEGLDLSKVERLTLRLHDDENEGADELFMEDLEPLLFRAMPALRHLTISHATFGPDLVEELPGARWFGRLDRLDLHHVTDGTSFLPPECAEALRGPDYEELRVDTTGSFSKG